MGKTRFHLALLTLAVGCAEAPRPATEAPGNRALGIADFQLSESPSTLTVVALDGQKQEVGRIELFIGRFTMSREFGNYGEVEGRKLNVDLRGVKQEHQARGLYALSLPQLNGKENGPLNAFMLDPHVRPVLEKWGVGFDGEAPILVGEGEQAYWTSPTYNGACDNYTGANHHTNGTQCTTVNGYSENTCNRDNGNAQILDCGSFADAPDSQLCGGSFPYAVSTFCCRGGAIATSLGKTYWAESKKCCNPGGDGCSTPCGIGGKQGCHVCWGPQYGNSSCTNVYASIPNSTCQTCGGYSRRFENVTVQ